MSKPKPEFECDLEPDTRCPRVRFNFANGWSGSLLIRTGENMVEAQLASVAAWPHGYHLQGLTEAGPMEASSDEALAWLAEIAARPEPVIPEHVAKLVGG